MSHELKPCPFCGGKAAWCDEHHKDDPHECHHIVCTACDAMFDMSGTYNPETLGELKEYCGTSFNTRAALAYRSEQASNPHIEWVSRIEMEDLMRSWLKERGWCQEHAEEITSEWCARFAEMYNGGFNKGMEVARRERASQPQGELIANMAMLMRRLLHSPDNTLLHSKTREFLRRNDLDGSVTR